MHNAIHTDANTAGYIAVQAPRRYGLQGGTHHVDELSDGQPEVDQHHVGGVGHRPRQLVVADEEVLQETLLCVAPGPLGAHWGHRDTVRTVTPSVWTPHRGTISMDTTQ